MNLAVKPIALDALAGMERKARALSAGNFDGVHLGHQLLLRTLNTRAAGNGLSRSVLTFHPHPMSIVAPERSPRLLTSLEDRVALLRRFGADEVIVLRFDEALSRMNAEAFVTEVLARLLDARHIVIGENFRFGNQQVGNAALLVELGARLGFTVDSVPLAHWRGRPVSSSEIRRQLLAGNVALAARLLGRFHALKGEVVRGRGVGAKQTVPTLNLGGEREIAPANGVYVTRTHDAAHGVSYPSITNIGHRPTFDDGHPERSIETFLLGPLAAQPTRITVEFLHRIRAERKFASPELLRAQILRDAARAQAYHRRLMKWSPGVLGGTNAG